MISKQGLECRVLLYVIFFLLGNGKNPVGLPSNNITRQKGCLIYTAGYPEINQISRAGRHPGCYVYIYVNEFIVADIYKLLKYGKTKLFRFKKILNLKENIMLLNKNKLTITPKFN